MNWVVLLFALTFGALWGTVQGMVMVQPGDARAVKRWCGEYCPEGVRNHQWFGVYHLVCAAMMLLGLALAMAWDVWWRLPSTGWGSGIAWSLGCVFLGWEASELGYSWSRWARWLSSAEHVTLVDAWEASIMGAMVRYIHAARVAAGVVCLILGGVL